MRNKLLTVTGVVCVSACASTPAPTVGPPCPDEEPPLLPTTKKAAAAPVDAGSDARVSNDVVVAQAEGVSVVKRLDRKTTRFVALVNGTESVLDGLVDTTPTVRVADVNGDNVADVIADVGASQPNGARFQVYGSNNGAIRTQPDDFVWRYMIGARDLDAAVAMLKKVERVDFSIPEVCGAIDRGVAVDTWTRTQGAWTLASKKSRFGWSCGALKQDGASFWMPELKCSNVVPACEASLISGGHAGTTLPNETQVFLERKKAKLEVVAIASDQH